MMSLKEFRKKRSQAGKLLHLVLEAERKGRATQAWKTYKQWTSNKISYSEAKKQLEKLLEKC